PYRRLVESHIEAVLGRVNPYTGRRYADEPAVSAWELANEATFVTCSTSHECLKSLPQVARDALTDAWLESSRSRDSVPSRPASEGDGMTSAYRRFIAERFLLVSEHLKRTARRAGG